MVIVIFLWRIFKNYINVDEDDQIIWMNFKWNHIILIALIDLTYFLQKILIYLYKKIINLKNFNLNFIKINITKKAWNKSILLCILCLI